MENNKWFVRPVVRRGRKTMYEIRRSYVGTTISITYDVTASRLDAYKIMHDLNKLEAKWS